MKTENMRKKWASVVVGSALAMLYATSTIQAGTLDAESAVDTAALKGVSASELENSAKTENAAAAVNSNRAPGSLMEFVEKAITSNPEVQARYHTFRAAEQEQKVARGGLFPRADVVTTFRGQDTKNENGRWIGDNSAPDRNTQLILRQMLFDGFATTSEMNRLDHASRSRYYDLHNTMQNIALDVVRAYIDIQRYRQLVDYAKDNYISHKQLFDRIEDRANAGVGRRVDLEQASGRLALAEANLLTETTNLHDVSARFQRLVGELPPDTLQEVDFFKAGVAPTASEALSLAYKQNPELLSAIEGIQSTKYEVSNKRSKYIPRMDFEARKNIESSSDGINSSVPLDSVQLTMSWNIFNGLSDISAVKQAAEKLNTSQDFRDKACIDTRQTVSIAYNDIQQLKQQMVYRNQHQLSIEKAREAYRKQFDIGQRTLLDLLDTENEYFQARRNYTIAERDLYTAYARTYAGQGDLLNKLSVSKSGLPTMEREEYLDSENVCKAVAPEPLNLDKLALVSDAKPMNIAAVPSSSPTLVATDNKVSIIDKTQAALFDVSSATIKPAAYPALDQAAEIIKGWGTSQVEVGGHTDQRKTSNAGYNMRLSIARANAVRNYLVKKGVPANRLSIKGYGYNQPAAQNDPINGNAVNRRVELSRK